MRTFVSTIAIFCIAVLGSSAVLYYAHGEPSTVTLNEDLRALQIEIKAADEESARYDGGLIKIMIEARKQTLQTNLAMLELKRASFIRRIDLKYEINGTSMPVADDTTLTNIEKDLEKLKAKLHSDEEKADRYSGGLIQSMALMAAATDRTTLSQLCMIYYARKYGLAIPASAGAPREAPRGTNGKVVNDKDAL